MSTVVLFDVNETLLDLSPIREEFASTYRGALDASRWFSELLRLSFVSSAIDEYRPFTELAGAALETVAAREGVVVRTSAIAEIGHMLSNLPAHHDVNQGLADLVGRGHTLAALTNSPLTTATEQLENAGIADYFARIMSVEMVQRFKPHRTVYEAAARSMHVPIAATTMVAAHDWDIAGAMKAGSRGVFVARKGQLWSTAFGAPDAVVTSLADLDQVVDAH